MGIYPSYSQIEIRKRFKISEASIEKFHNISELYISCAHTHASRFMLIVIIRGRKIYIDANIR